MDTKNTLYREKLLRLYKNPKNFGKLNNYNKKTSDHNPYCGDEIKVFLKKEGCKISNISWKGSGCVISQVSASMLTEKLNGKSITRIKKLNKEDVLDMFDVSINFAREKCALLIFHTLKKI